MTRDTSDNPGAYKRIDDRTPPMGEKQVTGYCDRWSAMPGETIQFMVNCDGPEQYDVQIIKLVHGDLNPDAPPYKEVEVDVHANGTYTGQPRSISTGSHVLVQDSPHLYFSGGFTLQALVKPTLPGSDVQGIVTKWSETDEAGYGLFVDENGDLSLRLGGSDGDEVRASTGVPLRESAWHLVAGTFDAEAEEVRLYQEELPEPGRETAIRDDRVRTVSADTTIRSVDDTGAPLVIAGCANEVETDGWSVTSHFDGKIESPRVLNRTVALTEPNVDAATEYNTSTDLVAAWDFAANVTDDGFQSPEQVVDRGPHQLHGTAVNLPTRGVTGYEWAGEEFDFTEAPDRYRAAHFHRDDLADAGWDVDFELTVPESMDSAVYAARLRTDKDEYYVPFYVRASPGTELDIVFLAPTNTYLAYANTHLRMDSGGKAMENVYGMVPLFERGHLFLSRHREYGLSLYDTHLDGSGSMFSSRLRPLIDISPKFIWGAAPPSNLHHFNADLCLINWLEQKGYEYDVVTDEDLHQEGVDLLEPYNVVLTGSHPEYHSRKMIEAIQGYQHSGGRIVYLGGNGFYWVTTFHPDRPQIVETRRGERGTESWVPEPGEVYHMFTGEKGGLWRQRGHPPQALVGVGFAAQWEPTGTNYQRLSDSYDEAVEFIFDGVDEERFGGEGLITGGAAGQEVDRYDPSLESPSDAYLLATSEDHTEYQRQVIEEFNDTIDHVNGRMNPEVRADIVYYSTGDGGAVFSTGSMSWVGSLSHNAYDGDVSRITENVVDAFASDEWSPDSVYE